MMRLVTNVLGVFAVKNGKLVKKVLFKLSPEEIAEKIKETAQSACAEELELVNELVKTGLREIAVNQPSRFWGKNLDIKLVEDSEKPMDVFQIAGELGLGRKDTESLLRDVNINLTREKLKVVEPDQVLMQAVSALDDLEEVSNKLVERLREWYSIHYPELSNLVENHPTYVQLVNEHGMRKNYSKELIKLEPAFRDRILAEALKSVGSDFTEKDMEAVKSIATNLSQLYKTQKQIEEYVDYLMKEIAPNTCALAGPQLGARLIKLSNGLKRMATLPSSTIQILGAEDAFFRFLKDGKRPPKHGVIFQHPEIRNAKREIRGKLSRTLASKIALAAKIDAYKGQYIGDKLNEDFMKRVKTLKK
ncbi:MAG: C/D box methylation guide ribonucleoprotein complex aNOP56 subunit [Candidatus Altiarchaeota archaeon]